MPKFIYNKFARDVIPEVIEKTDKELPIRILEQEEYKDAAPKEEDEVELADILELLHAYFERKSVSSTVN
ncbi:hypothetical protein [Planococcus sp. ISL-110]|uniref:hypothetical protein n=1 Tax=Planococcus sp. ISL-110 TaxID=2819167 RepID=UPI001BE7448A|nr:hypothetical protein [Planococcus sp. ISL-110]MBT2571130.1 hypothetical protein [Planococcus sp. ISL-110]